MGSEDVPLVIGAIVFGVLAAVFFVVAFVTQRVRGLKQQIRWAFALAAMITIAIGYTVMSLDQPEYKRSIDNEYVNWGRGVVVVASQTFVAVVITLGILVQTRNLIVIPLLTLFMFTSLALGMLPNEKKTSMQHWIWLIFAAVFWIIKFVVWMLAIFGIGADLDDEVSRQNAVFQTKSWAYKRGFVLFLVIALFIVDALYILFWCFDPALGDVWDSFWANLAYLIFDILVVGVVVFLVFFLHDPETNDALRSDRPLTEQYERVNDSSESVDDMSTAPAKNGNKTASQKSAAAEQDTSSMSSVAIESSMGDVLGAFGYKV